jgi:adenylate cyclase class 1
MIEPEPVLAISRAHSKDGTVVWLLHNHANASTGNQPTAPLKRFVNPVELLLWCWLNSITTRNTRWLSNQPATGLSIKELTLTNRFIETQLPLPEVLATSTDELAAPLRYKRLLIVVNLGHEPFADNARKGVHLASSRSDPLSYGDSKLNTVKQMDLIYTSAWGEVTCYSRSGHSAVGEALQRYLTELSVHGSDYPEPKFFGFSEHSGSLATERVKALFSNARQLVTDNAGHLIKLVYAAGPGFVLLERSGVNIQVQWLKNRQELVERISQPPPGPTVTQIDPLAGGIGDLALMAELNQFGAIQLFIHIDGRVTHLHVMDEGGAYMTQRTETYELQSLLQHLHLFVDNITRKLRIAGPDNQDIPVTYYQLLHGNSGEWQSREVELNVDGKEPVTDIHVLATPSSSGNQALSIMFNGEDFSSLKLGASLYQRVALEVLSHRRKRENYPVFITDVELEQPATSATPLQSIHYFKYKKSIEERLTAAMRERQVNEALPQPLEI